jgi:putative endonuclease
MTDTPWFVYLLECSNGRVYTGITTDIERRFQKHSAKKGAIFTRMNTPLRIIASQMCANRSEASKVEYKVKKLTATQKRRLALQWSIAKAQSRLPPAALIDPKSALRRT